MKINTRVAATLMSAAMLGSTLAAIVSAPAFAAPTGTTTPVRVALPGTDTVTDVLAVGSGVWVADGNDVLILTAAGQVTRTVTGILGAKGLTLSPDGESVYVSASTASKVFQLSTAGDTIGSWTVQGCPGKSAIVKGALYYAYTCGGTGGTDSGVGRLDLTTHEDSSVVTDIAAGALTAAASTLVTYNPDGSGYSLTSYTINDDGSLTKLASVQGDVTYDAEISADGSKVLFTDYTNGYGVGRHDTATMTLDGTFVTGAYPSAVAWSPSGDKFAGVESASNGVSALQFFDATTGDAVLKSPATTDASMMNAKDEAAWSPDGHYLYSLQQEAGSPAYLVITSTTAQTASTLSVSVTRAAAYGKNLVVTVRSNRVNTSMTVSVTQQGSVRRKVVTTNAAGIATWALEGVANGTAVAYVGANQTYAAATSNTASFTTPSALSTQTVGAKSVKNGVAHFASVSKFHYNLRVSPPRAAKVTATLQELKSGKWVNEIRGTFGLNAQGEGSIYLKSAPTKVVFRFAVGVNADSTAAASPTVYSTRFTID